MCLHISTCSLFSYCSHGCRSCVYHIQVTFFNSDLQQWPKKLWMGTHRNHVSLTRMSHRAYFEYSLTLSPASFPVTPNYMPLHGRMLTSIDLPGVLSMDEKGVLFTAMRHRGDLTYVPVCVRALGLARSCTSGKWDINIREFQFPQIYKGQGGEPSV